MGTPVRPGQSRSGMVRQVDSITAKFDRALTTDRGEWAPTGRRDGVDTTVAAAVADRPTPAVEADGEGTLISPFVIRLEDREVPMRTLNSRDSWADRHRAQKALKEKVGAVARQAWGARPAVRGRVRVEVTFVAADNHRRDADNIAPVLKGAQDGLVVAGVLTDDSFCYVPESLCRVRVDRDAGPWWEVAVVPLD